MLFRSVVRHYTNLSGNNFGVDNGFYPLGSCTMKYNPAINEETAALKAFAALHPLQPAETCQGALAVYYGLQKSLAALTGLSADFFPECRIKSLELNKHIRLLLCALVKRSLCNYGFRNKVH